MINTTTAARPYAQAVFEQASEEGDIARWSSLLGVLAVIASDPQMQGLLKSPKVSREQLVELVCGLCGDQLSSTAINFIRILVNTGRFSHAARIASLFEEKWAQSEGRMDISVTSAYPLEQDQENGIVGMMAERLGKKISVSSVVDETLIGGMVIRAGDSVIDVSLRGRLDELRSSLLR